MKATGALFILDSGIDGCSRLSVWDSKHAVAYPTKLDSILKVLQLAETGVKDRDEEIVEYEQSAIFPS